MEKNTLLKVTGIIVIVIASLTLLLSLFYGLLTEVILDVFEEVLIQEGVQLTPEEQNLVNTLIPMLGWILAAMGIFNMVVGIFGTWQKYPVACIALGIVNAVFAVVSLFTTGFADAGLIDFLWIGVTVLYVVGAFNLHKERNQAKVAEQVQPTTSDDDFF